MIAIVDYGAGNLFSVKNALDYIGAQSMITSTESHIRDADKIILPGVGSFPDAMKKLNEKELVPVLKDEGMKKPFLGICLGMQVLFEKGMEFEETEGLGFIGGSIEKLDSDQPGLKIPHMGWHDLTETNPCPLSKGIDDGDMVYFVHSYKAVTDSSYISMSCDYGQTIPGLVFRDSVYGCQFHPEKSGDIGLRILRNFVNL